jgi:peptidoglycan/LPS O-acetylase OafA/YrhL
MPPDPDRAGRFVALDALRGLAALLVVLYHLRWDWHGHDLVPVRHGFYAVDFFFVLSGFVMAATYGGLRSGADLLRFAVKRAGRLLPLHAAVLAGFVLLELGLSVLDRAGLHAGRTTFAGFTTPGALLAQASLTFGLIPGLDWLWNHPCWSIAVEIWTYLLFGLTVLAVRRGRPLAWILLSGLGLAVVARSPAGLAATSGTALFRCFASFFLGALVHAAYAALRRRGRRLGTGTQQIACILAGAAVLLPASSGWSLVIPVAFAGLVVSLAFDEGGVAQGLSARPLVRLGDLSYAIYLVHVPVWFGIEAILRMAAASGATWVLPDARAPIPALVSPFGSPLAADLLVLADLWLVLALAAWAHRRIEVPARLWSRQLAERGGPPGRPAAGASQPATAP